MIHFFEPEINLYIWYFLVLSGAVLCIVALLFLIRNDKREGHSSLLSALLILFVPIIGPLFYLVRFYKNKKLLALLFLAVSTQLYSCNKGDTAIPDKIENVQLSEKDKAIKERLIEQYGLAELTETSAAVDGALTFKNLEELDVFLKAMNGIDLNNQPDLELYQSTNMVSSRYRNSLSNGYITVSAAAHDDYEIDFEGSPIPPPTIMFTIKVTLVPLLFAIHFTFVDSPNGNYAYSYATGMTGLAGWSQLSAHYQNNDYRIVGLLHYSIPSFGIIFSDQKVAVGKVFPGQPAHLSSFKWEDEEDED